MLSTKVSPQKQKKHARKNAPRERKGLTFKSLKTDKLLKNPDNKKNNTLKYYKSKYKF